MPNTHRNHPDYEALRPQAVALRRAGLSRRQIRDRLHVHNNDILNRLLEGIPAPEWTRRPNTKDDLRERARTLRKAGRTYDEIQVELGCSKSSISLWVRDLPKPPPRRTPAEQARIAREKRWEHELAVRDSERRRTKSAATQEVGELSDRELLFTGAALYWAEGAKDKPYARREHVQFVNSDPGVIQLFHTTADVEAAERYWAGLVGVDVATFQKTTLKKHNPKTVRKNVGEGYRGCLVIRVLQSAELYRRIEGWWYGIVLGAKRPD
ncbi:hypothetical protein [Streptomyces decoyicus]|uniref:hypothetical protein n=1 Tax=Streptomyces decoyicus TaxID=249567 RepID=UPI0004AA2B9B|nr:hypothetical protein [Streptomyces decoyicus]KOG42740.1 hypothetical protein ADK74_16380 [Streptomyces decoyicus]QZY16435.1 hypothetical protein K7C20_15230 [Streptomyces decoyicus]